MDRVTVICRTHTTVREPNRESHPGIAGFAAAIKDDPAAEVHWLGLADWLEEQGLTVHAQTVRALWGRAEPPLLEQGRSVHIGRQGTYYENGGRHGEGVSISLESADSFGPQGWRHNYWANGNVTCPVDRDAARKLLTGWRPRYSSGGGLVVATY